MDFFDLIDKRRSVRKFSNETIPEEVITKALNAARKNGDDEFVVSGKKYKVKDVKDVKEEKEEDEEEDKEHSEASEKQKKYQYWLMLGMKVLTISD